MLSNNFLEDNKHDDLLSLDGRCRFCNSELSAGDIFRMIFLANYFSDIIESTSGDLIKFHDFSKTTKLYRSKQDHQILSHLLIIRKFVVQ